MKQSIEVFGHQSTPKVSSQTYSQFKIISHFFVCKNNNKVKSKCVYMYAYLLELLLLFAVSK